MLRKYGIDSARYVQRARSFGLTSLPRETAHYIRFWIFRTVPERSCFLFECTIDFTINFSLTIIPSILVKFKGGVSLIILPRDRYAINKAQHAAGFPLSLLARQAQISKLGLLLQIVYLSRRGGEKPLKSILVVDAFL